jgi:hypothetical protein
MVLAQDAIPRDENDIATECNNLINIMDIKICNISKSYNMRVNFVELAVLVFNVEETSKACNFKLTEEYKSLKSDLITDEYIDAYEEVKRLFADNLSKLIKQRTKKGYCDYSYESFGSKSKNGPKFYE